MLSGRAAAAGGSVMAQMSDRRRAWLDVMALVGLIAGLRLAYAYAVGRMLDSADAVRYLETAQFLSHGEFLSVDPKIPLLYPALTGVVEFLLRDIVNIEAAGQMVSFLFSVLLVIPVYFLAYELHGLSAARISGALVAMWPWLIDYSNRVATEPVAVFLWMTGALCFARGIQPGGSLRWMVGAGLAFGGLHLARPEGTFLLIGAVGMSAFLPRTEWGSAVVRKIGTYAAVTGAILAAHMVYMHRLTDQWTLNYRAGFIGEQPEGSTVLVDFGKTMAAMTADVPAIMYGPLLWAFFGVGLVVRSSIAPRRWRAEAAIFWMAALQWLVVIPVLSPAPRYLMAMFVALLPWVARGMDVAGRALVEATSWAWTRGLPVTLVAIWMAFHLTVAVAAERWGTSPQPWELKYMGEQMRDLESGVIVTRKPQVGFYAGMPTVGVAADATLEEIIEDAQTAGYRYLVVDDIYTAALVPALTPLLNSNVAPGDLEFVWEGRYQGNAARRVIVYRFLPPK